MEVRQALIPKYLDDADFSVSAVSADPPHAASPRRRCGRKAES